MFESTTSIYLIIFFCFLLVSSFLTFLYQSSYGKRFTIIERLRGVQLAESNQEDILERPFHERTVGALAHWLVDTIKQLTPQKAREKIEKRLEKAGNPYNLTASDLLAIQVILGLTVLVISWFILLKIGVSPPRTMTLPLILATITIYLPWFFLARLATKRQADIQRNLPDIMDLLVVSVEAGLGFDIALLKVAERFRGPVAQEFQQALKEIHLGRSRKEALKAMADRVDLMELSSLANAVVQSEQLGVGLSSILRMQADFIRDKRRQQVEEQAMKAPIKMLFPLVFFIFPSIFIIVLGPAILNIMKALGR